MKVSGVQKVKATWEIMKNPTTKKVIGGPKCAIYSIELKKSRSMLSNEIPRRAVPPKKMCRLVSFKREGKTDELTRLDL